MQALDHGWPSGEAWTSLRDDVGCFCALLNDRAEVIASNATPQAPLSEEHGTGVFSKLSADAQLERTRLVQTCAQRAESMTFRELIGGAYVETRLRPVADRRVLMVVNPRHAGAGAGVPVLTRHNDFGVLSRLTPREFEVMVCISRGMSADAIAQHFHRSMKTIESHRIAIGSKLGRSSRLELALLGVRLGLDRLTQEHTDSLMAQIGRGSGAVAARS